MEAIMRHGHALAMLFAGVLAATSACGHLTVRERVVAGTPDDFMVVRHLVLEGSNFEIGEHLAKIARERFGVTPSVRGDPVRNRAQREYFARNYPIFHERMRGVAAAFGESFEDDSFSLASLFYRPARPSCSVVFYPPQYTADGVGMLSRNYDFSTGTLWGTPPPEGQLGATARPYLLELHPDEGYASLALCSYDLLCGTIDGINSEGLTVALLADDEIVAAHGPEMNREVSAGLGVLHSMRLLLDTCANVEEAKAALLASKHYYSFVPCHYIVADRFGDSFVWEHSYRRNQEFIIDGDGEPQITTNFMQHLHPDTDELPEEPHPAGAFNRFRRLQREIGDRSDKLTLDEVKAVHRCVAIELGVPAADQVVGRTLWHAIYVPERRELHVDFYLGEDPEADEAATSRIRRSGYHTFTLR
jgi:hypothetical protein